MARFSPVLSGAGMETVNVVSARATGTEVAPGLVVAGTGVVTGFRSTRDHVQDRLARASIRIVDNCIQRE